MTSAFYMRQVLNYLFSVIGNRGVSMMLVFMFLCCVLYICLAVYSQKKSVLKLFLIGTALALVLLIAFRMRILEEKIHLIKYGLLGWLSSRDNIRTASAHSPVVTGVLVSLLVVIADETLQHYLPWRVGDIRDVVFGITGGISGALIYTLLYWRPSIGPEDLM